MSEKKRFQKQSLNKEKIQKVEKKAGPLRKIGGAALSAIAIGSVYVAKKAGPVVLDVAKKIIKL